MPRGWAWRQATGRAPEADEVAPLETLLAKHREHYTDEHAAAEALTKIGISPRDEKTDVVELAAWTSVCRVLLNLSETITRN